MPPFPRLLSSALTCSLALLPLSSCTPFLSTLEKKQASPLSIATHPCGELHMAHIHTDLLDLEKCVPKEASLGSPYTVKIHLTAKQSASNIMVTDTVPPQARFIQSEPGAMVSGNQISWRIEALCKGESRSITYSLEPKAEGNLTGCVSVIAIPQACSQTFVGKPQLHIQQHCSKAALNVGEKCDFSITVHNQGTAPAHDVTITEILPEGLQSQLGDSHLGWKIASLAPQTSKELHFSAQATERGSLRSVATVCSSNAPKQAAWVDCLCIRPGLDLQLDQSKIAFTGQKALYTLIASNPNKQKLKNLTLKEIAPSGTWIQWAPGATIVGNEATWLLDELDPGEVQQFSFALSSQLSGQFLNHASLCSEEGFCEESERPIQWISPPTLTTEIIDTPSPLLEGATASYRICVVNQEETPDEEVTLTARFPSHLTPQSACGATGGKIVGQNVSFEPYPSLAPRQAVEYIIQAKAMKAGEGEVEVELVSDSLESPRTASQFFHVY